MHKYFQLLGIFPLISLSDWNYDGYYENHLDNTDPKKAKGFNYHNGPVSYNLFSLFSRGSSFFLNFCLLLRCSFEYPYVTCVNIPIKIWNIFFSSLPIKDKMYSFYTGMGMGSRPLPSCSSRHGPETRPRAQDTGAGNHLQGS